MGQKTLDQIKELYEKGAMKKAQIDAMYGAGKITEDEYNYILSING